MSCNTQAPWCEELTQAGICCSLREFSVHHELRATEVMHALFSLPCVHQRTCHLSTGPRLCHVVNRHPSFPPWDCLPLSAIFTLQVWVGRESQPRRVGLNRSPGAGFWLFNPEVISPNWWAWEPPCSLLILFQTVHRTETLLSPPPTIWLLCFVPVTKTSGTPVKGAKEFTVPESLLRAKERNLFSAGTVLEVLGIAGWSHEGAQTCVIQSFCSNRPREAESWF